MTISKSDSIVVLGHLFSTANKTTCRITLASSSSIDRTLVDSCHPPHISPSWSRAMAPIHPWPVTGHLEASLLILMVLVSDFVHLRIVVVLRCTTLSAWKICISSTPLCISCNIWLVFGCLCSKTSLHRAFQIA